jgi:cell division septal protein FtsQ
VRISLIDRKPQKGKRQKRLKKKRRLRTFDSAISQPQALPAPRVKARRSPAKKATSSRRARSKQSTAPAASTGRTESWLRNALARLLATAALAAAIGVMVYGSVNARFFVYHAKVLGTAHVEAETIYRQAGVHEQNIFWIRPQQVATRIQQIDGIRSVQVRTGLPAQVSIQVQEREPVVMWRSMAQKRDWWLDEEGKVLPYPGNAESPEMIFVVDSSSRQLEPGESLQPAGLVRSVQQLAAAVPGSRVFYYDGARELSFTQQVEGDQWPVYVGTSDDLPRKIQVLQVLDRYLQDNDIHPRYVDVRWADHPLYNAPSGQGAGENE